MSLRFTPKALLVATISKHSVISISQDLPLLIKPSYFSPNIQPHPPFHPSHPQSTLIQLRLHMHALEIQLTHSHSHSPPSPSPAKLRNESSTQSCRINHESRTQNSNPRRPALLIERYTTRLSSMLSRLFTMARSTRTLRSRAAQRPLRECLGGVCAGEFEVRGEGFAVGAYVLGSLGIRG